MKRNNDFLNQRGGMLIELLLTLALVSIMLPFVIKTAKDRIERAENIATTRKMDSVKNALERYIDANQKELLIPVGKNITRVKISDLETYGLATEFIEKNNKDFQLRVVKTADQGGRATLHGLVLLNSDDVTPLKTREVVNLGSDNMGFLEQGQAFGAYGTWRADAIDFGLLGKNGILETTGATYGGDLYLWRLPSTSASDGTMLSALNLGGHNIENTKFLDVSSARFEEVLRVQNIASDKMIFQTRPLLDKKFITTELSVIGNMSSDSKNMEIFGTLHLADTANLSSITAENLWVDKLNLEGLTIARTENIPSILKVNQTLDMTAGHINATFVGVGFTGSITPKLVIKNRIEDSSSSEYFWDASSKTAVFMDASFAEINRMAPMIYAQEKITGTVSGQIFGGVLANKNATAADFLNAISKMQISVIEKYRQLNLE